MMFGSDYDHHVIAWRTYRLRLLNDVWQNGVWQQVPAISKYDHHVKKYWAWRLSKLVDGVIVRVRLVS
jgi:hypothetical protein